MRRSFLILSLGCFLFVAVPSGAAASAPQSCLRGGTFASAEEMAAFFIAGLAEGASERIWSLALNEAEFRAAVWPHLPAARPGTNFSPEFVWQIYDVRNRAAFERLIEDWGGSFLEFVDLDIAEVDDYGAFRIHRDPVLRVRDASGRERSVRLFGSIIEQDGNFKLYAFRTE